MPRFLRFPNNSASKPKKRIPTKALSPIFTSFPLFLLLQKCQNRTLFRFFVRRFRSAFPSVVFRTALPFGVPVRRSRSAFPFGVSARRFSPSFSVRHFRPSFFVISTRILLQNVKYLPCRYTKNAHLCKRSTLRDVRYFCLSQNRFVQQTCANFLPRMSIQFLKIAKRQSIKPKSKNFSVLPPFAAAFSSALRRKACV